MKIDANNSVYSVQELKNSAPTFESKPATSSVVSAKREVEVNMHDQNVIAENSAKLNSMPEVDLARVAQIQQRIASGDIQFDMGELAKVLVNVN